MTPHPPRPTLFPYTTLFRSGSDSSEGRERAAARSVGRHAVPGVPRARSRRPDVEPPRLRWIHQMAATEGRDRKSTRLNSSHTVISYAVFCLKKKKKKHKTIR